MKANAPSPDLLGMILDHISRLVVVFFLLSCITPNSMLSARELIAYTDFHNATIETGNASLSIGVSFQYNSYYKDSWRIVDSSAGFMATFTAPSTGQYNLIVTHLTSGSSQCPGGGYSPITIKLNGNPIVSAYDPAQHHEGSHGMVTDTWQVTAGKGLNRIEWITGNICTHYWIQRIEFREAGPEQTLAAYADFQNETIQSNNLIINPGYYFEYNDYYQENWRILAQGGGFTGKFIAPVAGEYNLEVTHLTSGSSQCPGGGFSPTSIYINGSPVVSNYDPAENHDGSHGYVKDTWRITANAGGNTFTWLAGEHCTHYWIQDLKIWTIDAEPPQKPSKAIIVAGSGAIAEDPLWPATRRCADYAYKVLLYQGYSKENIRYLCAEKNRDVDGDEDPNDVHDFTTINNLYEAITWAEDAETLFLYFVNHGGVGKFQMNSLELLDAINFDMKLDTLQGIIPGKIVMLYDACKSGSFLPLLTPPEGKSRIIATTASETENSLFLEEGILSFSFIFWSGIFAGDSFYRSYVRAKNSVSHVSSQTPSLDSNGNGVGNEKEDKETAQGIEIGAGKISGGGYPVIHRFSDPITLAGSPSATIWAEDVIDADGIKKVWAVITPPGFAHSSEDTPVLDLPTIELSPLDNGRYEAAYDGFTNVGEYKITIFANDTERFTSLPQQTSVIQTVEVNPAKTVSGRVSTTMAGHDDLSVINAIVSIEGTSYTAVTNSSGIFTFQNVAPGSYTLNIDAPNCQPASRQITVKGEQNETVDIAPVTSWSQEDVNQSIADSVLRERQKWDIKGDNKKGLEEAIDALQVISGVR